MVRAKFRVANKELAVDGGGKITLDPVYSGSKENDEFYRMTPMGNISLETVNQMAYDEFEVSKEYYVDFTKAE